MKVDEQAQARPICIGPRNAESMTGHSWRWLRDHARELGVDLIAIDGKRVLMADQLLEALQRRGVAAQEPNSTDDLEAFRERIRRAG